MNRDAQHVQLAQAMTGPKGCGGTMNVSVAPCAPTSPPETGASTMTGLRRSQPATGSTCQLGEICSECIVGGCKSDTVATTTN